jgi:hypothetical protein
MAARMALNSVSTVLYSAGQIEAYRLGSLEHSQKWTWARFRNFRCCSVSRSAMYSAFFAIIDFDSSQKLYQNMS